MKNENRNEEAVSPVIATILMVAITVVLAGVLYVWASSLAEGNTDGNLTLYVFDGEDASGAPSDGTTDNLIRMSMTKGENINWANLKVQIEVDNAAPVTCDNPGQDSGAVCVLVPFEGDGGQFWSVGDGVTIQESGQDLCTASCTIDVAITDTREGTVIDNTNGVSAEADQA